MTKLTEEQIEQQVDDEFFKQLRAETDVEKRIDMLFDDDINNKIKLSLGL